MAYIGTQPSLTGDPVLDSLSQGTIPIEMKNTATSALQVPQGTTAQRPAVNAVGKMRYNSELAAYEAYVNAAWGQMANANVSTTFTKPQKSGTLSLTHNTAWDGTDKQHLLASVNGSSFTIANPSAHTSGVYYVLFVTYVTSHSIVFGNMFKGLADITPTALAGSYDHFTFRSDGTNLHLVGAAYNVGA